MSTWTHVVCCHRCRAVKDACECDSELTYDRWELRTDADRRVVAQVENFDPEGDFYGTWAGGRTGAVRTLERCQKRVEQKAFAT